MKRYRLQEAGIRVPNYPQWLAKHPEKEHTPEGIDLKYEYLISKAFQDLPADLTNVIAGYDIHESSPFIYGAHGVLLLHIKLTPKIRGYLILTGHGPGYGNRISTEFEFAENKGRLNGPDEVRSCMSIIAKLMESQELHNAFDSLVHGFYKEKNATKVYDDDDKITLKFRRTFGDWQG